MRKYIKKFLHISDVHITLVGQRFFWNSYMSGHNFENLLEQCPVKNMAVCMRGKNVCKKIHLNWYFIWIYRKENFTEKGTCEWIEHKNLEVLFHALNLSDWPEANAFLLECCWFYSYIFLFDMWGITCLHHSSCQLSIVNL